MNTYITGSVIRRLRENKNMTQTELADKLGVSSKAVSKWETGKSKPTTNVIRKLAVLFKIDINELLSLKDKEMKMEMWL